jgi:uncharacterized membrane-anchored protein
MSDNKKLPDYDQPWNRYKDAITASARLAREDGDKALQLVDDAIAVAVRENQMRWVMVLNHHAAVISNFLGKPEQEKRYYQESLAHSPENFRALYGLATVAKKQGDPEVAKGYATRCYKSLTEGDEFLKDSWLEMLLKQWPDVAQ